MRPGGEDGYALVAAVAGIAVFSALALICLSAIARDAGDAAAELDRLQVGAAADAGVALALSHLLSDSLTRRWPIGGGDRRLAFAGAQLRIRIEDERGKVPIARLDPAQAERLLAAAGLDGDRLRVARDSLLDWTDADDEPRPFGAESAYYRAAGIVPPNGPLASIDELGRVRGFDAATVARLRPIVTTYTATAPFDPTHAAPAALAVMAGDGPQAIARARDASGQRPAIAFTDAGDVSGRPLTLVVAATLPDGAQAVRRVVVELTGVADRPYLVRAAD